MEAWVRSYDGSSAFVLKMKTELAKPGFRFLTARQLAVVGEIRSEEEDAQRPSIRHAA